MTSLLALTYGMFFLGYLLHMGLQIDAVVRSSKNASTSRLEVIKENLFVLGSRLFISFISLILLRNHPEYLGPILGFAGVTVSNISVATSSWLFAGMWGYTVDSILTFIPMLKNYIPLLNDVKVSVSTITQPGTTPKTTTTVETVTQIPPPATKP